MAVFALSGLVAAPLAAWLVRLMPAHVLGVIVGGAIVLTNTHTLLGASAASPALTHAVIGVGTVCWLSLVAFAVRQYRVMAATS